MHKCISRKVLLLRFGEQTVGGLPGIRFEALELIQKVCQEQKIVNRKTYTLS